MENMEIIYLSKKLSEGVIYLMDEIMFTTESFTQEYHMVKLSIDIMIKCQEQVLF